MANPHNIAGFPAAFWRGDQPDFSKQRVSTHTRPGANGVGRIVLGRSGKPFTAELEFHAASWTAAMLALAGLENLTGQPPIKVVYNYTRLWLAPFRHLFYVDDVRLLRLQMMPRIIGPGYNYLAGVALVVNVDLQPFATF